MYSYGLYDRNEYLMDYQQMLSKRNDIDIALLHIKETIEYLELDKFETKLELLNFETKTQKVYRDLEGKLEINSCRLPSHLDDKYREVEDYTTWTGRYMGFTFKGAMDSKICQDLKAYSDTKQPQLLFRGVLYDSVVKSGYDNLDCMNLKYYVNFYILEHDKREVTEGKILKKKVRKENDDIPNYIFFHEMEVSL